MDDEDIIMPDEDVSIPAESEEGNTESAEQKENQPDAQAAQPEDEDKKVLDYLNGKGLIKFNGEKVDIKDLNDLVSNYQKGLNYDKHNADDQYALDYIKGNASKLGIGAREYINRVKNYEEEKKREAQEQDVQKYVNQGIDESIAREIVQTRLAREEFEKEKAEYQKRIAEDEKKRKEDEEYIKFIDSHPGLKVEDIPQEVFENSKSIGIDAAYNQYKVKELEEKIKQMEQSLKNASTSPVGLTSDGSSTEQQSKDAFLEGFDSVI